MWKIFLFILLVSCGEMKHNERSEDLDQKGSVIIHPDSALIASRCPDGFIYDSDYDLCVNDKESAGPFTPLMVEKCKKFGGGPACDGDRWEVNFAKDLRGKRGKTLSGLKVAIDSGHGRYFDDGEYGREPGAVNKYYSLMESDLNLYVSERVKAKLESMGATVSLFDYTKPSSPYLDLFHKGARAEGNNILVSIHHNAFNKSAQGAEVLVYKSPTNRDITLASVIQKNLMKKVWNGDNDYNRGVKSKSLGVLRGTPYSVECAVLVEGFFMDTFEITPNVAKMMDEKVADAVVEGIRQYWVSER